MLRWDPGQLIVEADAAHAMRVVQAMRLQDDPKGAEAPAVREPGPVLEENPEMPPAISASARRT